MKGITKRIISMIIAMLMLFSMTATFAIEAEPAAEPFETAEAPVEEPAEEPVDELSEDPIVEPAEEPVEGPEEDPVEEPIAEEPVDEPAEEPVEKTIAEEILAYTVTFYDGEAVLFTQQVVEGESAAVPEAPVKEGYVFIEWYTADTDAAYAFGAVTDDISVYARFRPITYTVIYNMNSEAAEGETAASVHAYDIPAALTACGFTMGRTAFLGWALEAEGEIAYTDTQEVVNLTAEDGAEVVLYAVWNTLPYGFTGMPAGFVLSEEQQQAKAALAKHGALESLKNAVAGEDYIEGQIIYTADSQEFAKTVAAAYSAQLISYSYGVALAQLSTATVLQAVEVAADPANNMPAVSQNGITRVDPIISQRPSKLSEGAAAYSIEAPELQTWFDRPNDEFLQDPHSFNYQWMHEAVNTYAAWGVTMGEGATVAVLDTGYTPHEDIDSISIIEMEGQDGQSVSDHGSHVAGIIGATGDNEIGGCGIAPEADMISINVFDIYDPVSDDYLASDYACISGIITAVENGANIINMSFGGEMYNDLYQQAIHNAANKGVVIVAAMGNNYSNLMCYPAAYDNVIAVAASDRSGEKTSFSTYGDWADVAAPGDDIISTVPFDYYMHMDGTSQAAPIVSGVAALYVSAMGSGPNNRDLNGDGCEDIADFLHLESALKKAVNKTSSKGIGTGIIDASKLFGSIKEAPIFTVTDCEGNIIDNLKTPVPHDAVVEISGADNNSMIIYTTDGKAPAVKNGEVTYGDVYNFINPYYCQGPINLSEYQAGQKLTIKAMCISGMGVIGKAGTLTITIADDAAVTGVEITESTTKLFAGKSFTFKAKALPELNAPQDITWSIVNRNGTFSATTLDAKKGVLKIGADDYGTLTIRATSVANNQKYDDAIVKIDNLGIVKNIVMSKNITLDYSGKKIPEELITLSIDSLDVTIGKQTSTYYDSALIANYPFKWTTSNDNVVAIIPDEYNSTSVILFPEGAGSATITCMATDGSGKKATCKVTVNQLPEKIEFTNAPTAIAPGKKAAFKATVLPSKANDKTIIWDIPSAPDGVSIDSKGNITVAKEVQYGTKFTVVATSAADRNVYSEVEVTVAPLATKVYLYPETDPHLSPVKFNKDGTISSLTLYNTDLDPDDNLGDNRIWLDAYVDVPIDSDIYECPVQWSSSNPKLVTVDQNGHVVTAEGGKGGKATITCTALDGSKKKASVSVNVAVPMSDITIKSKNGSIYENNIYETTKNDSRFDCSITLAQGKSCANTVTFGNAYGTPTLKKVEWYYDIGYAFSADVDGTSYACDYWASTDDGLYRLFDHYGSNIKLSSSGSLSVSAKTLGIFRNDYWRYIDMFLEDHNLSYDTYVYCDLLVDVIAVSADDDRIASNWLTYCVVEPTTTMGAYDAYSYDYPYKLVNSCTYRKTAIGTEFIDGIRFYSDSRFSDYTITSSNPRVASTHGSVKLWYAGSVKVKGKYYDAYELYLKTDAPGKTTITITANDGTKKNCKFNLTVTQGVVAISDIEGPAELARGKSATYKATVLPTNANNKKLLWGWKWNSYRYPDLPDYVKLSSSGKLTVNKKLPENYVGATVTLVVSSPESYWDNDTYSLTPISTIDVTLTR